MDAIGDSYPDIAGTALARSTPLEPYLLRALVSEMDFSPRVDNPSFFPRRFSFSLLDEMLRG